jgi:Icc-related predicted phosphoesterase
VITVVAISDTHGYHDRLEIPPGDILVHAGDLTLTGALGDVAAFNGWLGRQPHPHKVVIAGNHDWCFQREREAARALLTHGTYLQDEAAVVGGLRFYGSPWQPWFLDWAFNLPRGEALAAKWAMIPEYTEVLVTHGPPQGIGDRVYSGKHVGCEEMAERVALIRPRLHIFGHIHEAAGRWTQQGTTFVNASALGHGAAVISLESE